MSVYYRIEDRVTDSTINIAIVQLEEMHRTPKGVWVRSKDGGNKFFIRNVAPHPSAYPTLAGALEAYLKNKARSRGILAKKLQVLDQLVALATKALTNERTTTK